MLKIGIQVVSNILYVLFSRLDSFFWDPGILWVLFGCFLVSLELFLRGMCSQNFKKNISFLRFLFIAALGFLIHLMGVLVSSWLLLGCFGFKMGS